MADRSYVAQRASDRIDSDFPARPTLSARGPCHGLAFVGRSMLRPDLRPLRHHVSRLWHGPITAEPGAPHILLVAFDRAVAVDGDAWPGALPLTAADGFAWRSFAAQGDVPRPPSPATDSGPRWIDLWWGGARRRVAVDSLEPLPIADLWELPVLEVHPPAPRIRSSAAADDSRDDGAAAHAVHGGSGAGDGGAPGRSRVSTAPVPIDAKSGNKFSDLTDALNRNQPRGAGEAFARLFRGLGSLGGERSAGGGMADPRQRASRAPGPLVSLMGWLNWHNPLGGAIQQRYAGRLNQVEKLIASGDIDAALKLALKLGSAGSDNLPKRYPNRLPPGRATLDFDMAASGFSVPILDTQLFMSLQWRYRELADTLEKDGDCHRAAYIHSQLLNDHARAVEVLEKGDMFLEAARLALDARLEPAVAIALFFKAGDLDSALALAKRTACFERLAEHSRDKGGEYHAYVMRAWTDMLVATGQRLRALQVTDQLAADDATDPALLAERRRWLTLALNDASGDALDAELIARALLTARWNDDIATRDLDDFPWMNAIRGEPPFVMALDQMQLLMRGDAMRAGDALVDLMIRFVGIAAPKSPEQVAFWNDPAPIIVERFARALVEQASNRLTPSDFQTLHILLTMASLPVLAADLGKLRKLHAAPVPARSEWRVPPATVNRPPVRHACLLADGTILAWREGDQLELIDRHGTSVWTRTVSNVLGLVAIGTSPDVIVIQAQRDGSCALSRFASHRRSFIIVGTVDLLAWHDITSESQWLVQIGGTIGALDLIRLFAPSPEFLFSWSCALTERLRVLSFADFPQAPSWVTCDISPERAGLVERWTLASLAELTTHLCVPPHSPDDPATLLPADWHWDLGRMGATGDAKRWIRVLPWGPAEERTALQYYAARRDAGIAAVDTFQPLDRGRPVVGVAAADKLGEWLTSVAAKPSAAAAVKLRHGENQALRCLARRMPAAHGGARESVTAQGVALLADNNGRLFKVDISTGRVAVF